MRWSKSKLQGFTLIELLIAIGVMVTVSTIALTILTVILRSSEKANLMLQLKQNGNAALSQMVDAIRYAKSLDSPASCMPSVTLTPPSLTITSLQDNGQTTYACSANTISSNSASLIDTNAFTVSSCSFVCSQSSADTPPTITIQFTLQTKTQNNFVETTASLPFESAVTLRNVQ